MQLAACGLELRERRAARREPLDLADERRLGLLRVVWIARGDRGEEARVAVRDQHRGDAVGEPPSRAQLLVEARARAVREHDLGEPERRAGSCRRRRRSASRRRCAASPSGAPRGACPTGSGLRIALRPRRLPGVALRIASAAASTGSWSTGPTTRARRSRRTSDRAPRRDRRSPIAASDSGVPRIGYASGCSAPYSASDRSCQMRRRSSASCASSRSTTGRSRSRSARVGPGCRQARRARRAPPARRRGRRSRRATSARASSWRRPRRRAPRSRGARRRPRACGRSGARAGARRRAHSRGASRRRREPHRDDGSRAVEGGDAQTGLGAADDRHGPARSRRASILHRGNVCNMRGLLQVLQASRCTAYTRATTRRSSSAGQSACLVSRGSRVRIPTSALETAC